MDAPNHQGSRTEFAIQAHVVALWGRGFDQRAFASQKRRGRANACGAPTEPSIGSMGLREALAQARRATCAHKSRLLGNRWLPQTTCADCAFRRSFAAVAT